MVSNREIPGQAWTKGILSARSLRRGLWLRALAIALAVAAAIPVAEAQTGGQGAGGLDVDKALKDAFKGGKPPGPTLPGGDPIGQVNPIPSACEGYRPPSCPIGCAPDATGKVCIDTRS